jgi:hypothetical protein
MLGKISRSLPVSETNTAEVPDLSGTTTYYNPDELPNRIDRSFPLLGLNGEWQPDKRNTVYGGVFRRRIARYCSGISSPPLFTSVQTRT